MMNWRPTTDDWRRTKRRKINSARNLWIYWIFFTKQGVWNGIKAMRISFNWNKHFHTFFFLALLANEYGYYYYNNYRCCCCCYWEDEQRQQEPQPPTAFYVSINKTVCRMLICHVSYKMNIKFGFYKSFFTFLFIGGVAFAWRYIALLCMIIATVFSFVHIVSAIFNLYYSYSYFHNIFLRFILVGLFANK